MRQISSYVTFVAGNLYLIHDDDFPEYLYDHIWFDLDDLGTSSREDLRTFLQSCEKDCYILHLDNSSTKQHLDIFFKSAKDKLNFQLSFLSGKQ